MEWQMLKEKQECSCCGKIDKVIATEEEFLCIECLGKKYLTPEEIAEAEKIARTAAKELDDFLTKQGDS